MELEVEVIGGAEILRAFRDLPKQASEELREASTEIATGLVADLQAAARAEGRQAALMVPTVKVKRDRIPVIQAGGSKRVGRKRVPAGKLLYGSEFGSNLRQFRPHLGTGSYWFYRTVQARDGEIYAEWLEAADRIMQAFGEG